MSLEFPNSSYDTTETKITTPQETGNMDTPVDSTISPTDTAADTEKEKFEKIQTEAEKAKARAEAEKQKKFDELKKIFPALANTPNLKNSESIITTLKQFSDSFITKDSKS